jgi:alkylation response protein AidB-like acyl-CoA dehydrogenase
VLFRLGELIAWVEGAGALARRAARARANGLSGKSDKRLDADALAAAARIFAREAAAKVAGEGIRIAMGADGVTPAERPDFERVLGLSALHDAQAGLIADADALAGALYAGIED